MTESEVPTTAADQEKLKEIVAKDSKSGRAMTGFWYWLCSSLAVGMVLFYMYCAATPVDTQYFLGLYVMITYVLIFLSYPYTSATPNKFGYYVDSVIPLLTLFLSFYFTLHFLLGTQGARQPFTGVNWVYAVISLAAAGVFFVPLRHWGQNDGRAPIAMDIFLALAAVFVVGYYIVEYAAINYRMGSESALDTAVSFLGILISLDVARRVLGWSMTLVGVSFLLYAFYGDLLHSVPVIDSFAHTGFKMDRALNHIYYKQEGVFGIMASVLVTYVILFIFFGSFLKFSGASRFFIDLPMALAGKAVGGPAKVAVLASGFFGSVSGSAIANTVSTGSFTIPLMKKAGFRPHVAGAIEPSASIGGMFMPPIMGAGGFIMAEM
ncbi:MAG: TRAP transporter large permease subunit, partial [Desulfobacterales bacterium]